MKIAMIGHKRIPSREGGVEVVVEALSVGLAARGHSVTVYNRSGHHIAGEAFDQPKGRHWHQGVRICEVPVIDRRGLSALTGSLFATLRALFGRYDCIHYHAEGPCAMLWLPHLFRIGTVATIHGLDWQRSKWNRFASWYLRQGEKMAAKYADQIIVLSENTRRYFKETYDRETVLIPNGVNPLPKRAAHAITEHWGLKKDDYLLYLGRIVPEKGLHYLIDAFQKVRTEKKLVIAGSPSDTATYYNQIQAAAKEDERVLFTGFVQGQLLEELYSNAYLYCLPSDLEGMPLSLLEAISYGNCCLTSDIAECAGLVGDHGYCFSKGNAESLRETLQMLCDQPELVQHCRNTADESIRSLYSWDDVVEKTLSLYRTVINDGVPIL